MSRSTVMLFLLLVVLGVVTLWLLPSKQEREASYAAGEVNIELDSASVTRIDIRRSGNLLTLQNVAGVWMITSPNQYPADPTIVKQLIGGFSKFKVGSLISSNPDKQNVFQVDTSGSTVTVTERSGKSLTMIVGKMGPSFSEVYFRMPDSKDVYLGEGIDSWSLAKGVKEWRDKAILSIPSESIKELVYTEGTKIYSFIRDSSGWKSGGNIVNAPSINAPLSVMSNLRSDDFIDSAMQFPSNPTKVLIKGAEDITLTIHPLAADSSTYVVQSSKSKQLYSVSKWTVADLLKPIDEFTPPTSTVKQSSIAEKKKVAELPKKKTTAKKIESKPSTPPVTATKKPVEQTSKGKTSQTVTPPATSSQTSPQQTPPAQKVQPPPVTRTETPKKQVTPPTESKTVEATTGDEDAELTVHTVKKGETMTTISKKYNVSVEQIIKWNLLKSISVKPGQELYIFIKK
jgi:LysM repeat protein